MSQKRYPYPYSKKRKKRHPSSIIHEIELNGCDVIVDGILFESAGFDIRPSYESVKVSLEFLAKIKSQR